MFILKLMPALVIVLALLWWFYTIMTQPLTDENGNAIAGPGLSPIDFPEANVQIAKDQPEYRTLPAFVETKTLEGEVITCWQLSFRDRIKILVSGRLWCSIWTFQQPLQPLYFSVHKADVLEASGE